MNNNTKRYKILTSVFCLTMNSNYLSDKDLMKSL